MTTSDDIQLSTQLDPQQRAIAYDWQPDGNLRVAAAAGSGKTTTLTNLVGRLIRDGMEPEEIIATTFSRKAGRELKDKLEKIIGAERLDRMRVGTFHALGMRTLASRKLFAQGRNWDDSDKSARRDGIPYVKWAWKSIVSFPGFPDFGIDGVGLDDKLAPDYKQAADLIRARAIDWGSPEALKAAHEVEARGLENFVQVWSRIEQLKRTLNAWEYADILSAWYLLLRRGEAGGARVVIVDEAQDNSLIQLRIAQTLAKNGSLVLVGDSRQSIYEWRGAYPDMFIHADRELGAQTLEIGTNYRSKPAIVELGNRVARGKFWAIGADAKPNRATETGGVALSGYATAEEEAVFVAEDIRIEREGGRPANDFAILFRTNAQAALFETELIRLKVPVAIIGRSFWDRAEVRDVRAYLTLSQRDDFEAFERATARPRGRYLGKVYRESVRALLGSRDLLTAAEEAGSKLRTRNQREGSAALVRSIRDLRAAGWPTAAFRVPGILDEPDTSEGEADNSIRDNIATAAAIASQFAGPDEMDRFAELCVREAEPVSTEGEAPTGRVVLSTIHRSKGLEWPVVYVPASVGVFPHPKANKVEEERLFYVAVTRAKDDLRLTYADVNHYGFPSGPSVYLNYASQEPSLLPDK